MKNEQDLSDGNLLQNKKLSKEEQQFKEFVCITYITFLKIINILEKHIPITNTTHESKTD